jgi:hypothetical protein
MNITPQEILAALGPRSGTAFIYDLFLYVIFVLALITMFAQSDKQLVPTMLIGGAAACTVIAKLGVLPPKDFGMLIVNAGILVLPLLTAGITRAKKTIPLCVIIGVLGAIHFFLFWFFSQRT